MSRIAAGVILLGLSASSWWQADAYAGEKPKKRKGGIVETIEFTWACPPDSSNRFE